MKYELKYISPLSVVFSVVPLVLFSLGFLAALGAFVFFPSEFIKTFSLVKLLTAILASSVIYTVTFTSVILIGVFIYNFFSLGLGVSGIKLEFNPVEENKD